MIEVTVQSEDTGKILGTSRFAALPRVGEHISIAQPERPDGCLALTVREVIHFSLELHRGADEHAPLILLRCDEIG